MRNPPPQQESYPQRQFPLAQFRYGREEMLAIFEQFAAQPNHHELEPAQLGDVPPDFPEMTDGGTGFKLYKLKWFKKLKKL